MHELERALGRARVGLAEPQVAIDDADVGELREVVALGHHLRADDDVGLAGLDLLDDLAHLGQRRHEVGREQRNPRLREPLGNLLGNALDAGSAGNEAIPGMALRAGGGRRRGEAAMMADQLALETVIHQPRAHRSLVDQDRDVLAAGTGRHFVK